MGRVLSNLLISHHDFDSVVYIITLWTLSLKISMFELEHPHLDREILTPHVEHDDSQQNY